ncbi:MAG: hypothetical protein ACJ8FS_11235 [Sphingomicrobium sp.]
MQLQLPIAQRVGLIILILFALAWYAYARTHKPAPAMVNGTYRNVCCGAVTLRDGAIIGESARAPFTLENMKFGVTAYLPHRVVVRGNQVVMLGAQTDGSISFSNDGRSFTLCGASDCGHEFKFVRVSRS